MRIRSFLLCLLLFTGCVETNRLIERRSSISLADARQTGFRLFLAETDSANAVGTKFFTVSSADIEFRMVFRGSGKGQGISTEEHELISAQSGKFVWKTTNRKISYCGEESFKTLFSNVFDQERDKITRETFNSSGSMTDSDNPDSSNVLVQMNIPSRTLKINDTWEGSIIYQLNKNRKEKSIMFKIEEIELRSGAVSAKITYNYEYDSNADDGSTINSRSQITDWIDVNTGITLFREEIGQIQGTGLMFTGKETIKRVANLADGDIPCHFVPPATPMPTPTLTPTPKIVTPTPIATPIATPTNTVSKTETFSNSNSLSNATGSTRNATQTVYAEVKAIGYALRSKPDGEELWLDGNPLWLTGDARLLLISPTNCKACHQDGWYHIKILGTGFGAGKEGWVESEAIYFVD